MSHISNPLLTAIVWVLSFVVEPIDDISQLPAPASTSSHTIDTAIAKRSTEIDMIYEIRRRRSVHSITARQHWVESYGTKSPSASPPTIMWTSDVREPITCVASLSDLDDVLFKDTTPPVSYYADPNMKGVLKN
jgi:hypothetical protein